MARYRSAARVSRGTNRKFVWARSRFGGTFTGEGMAPVDMLSAYRADSDSSLAGVTVVRVRGYIVAAPETAIDGGCRFAMKVINGVQIQALPTNDLAGPYEQQHSDWMLWEPFGSNVIIDTDEVSNRVIDVKAQRKIEELDEELTMFAQGTPSVPAAIWHFAWDLSIGLKLP